MTPTAELLLVLGLILINALFVMSEMAIVSARKVRLQQLANQGSRQAAIALDLALTPHRFLPTVQVGITLMGILSGARGESAISRLLSPQLEQWLPSEYSEGISSTIAVAILTYLTLIIGELVPKQLALSNPEKIASFLARPIDLLARLSHPLIFVLGNSTNFVLNLLRIKPSTEPEVTEEEIKVLIEQGTETGMFEESEQDMVQGYWDLAIAKLVL
nr:CNNM domain-containing protein [Chamaesiphon polymorphus]